jgi:hypothetical protein
MILPFLSFAIEPFVCIKNSQNTAYIASRPSIECYSKEWKQRLPFGIIMIVIYGIIMPLNYAISLNRMESTQSIRLRNRFGSLIENYKPDFL